MPTPFTHLEYAQRFLCDERLSSQQRLLIEQEKSAFLLGNIAADARVGSGTPRSSTHFYAYGKHIRESPWRLMLKENPNLWSPQDSAHRIFIAGYVAHLSIDEYWAKYMVTPHFFEREWGERRTRFIMLHVILIHMDQRDLQLLEGWQAEVLNRAVPSNWLDFISDADLMAWQKLIYDQIKPDGISETLQIFGERTGIGADGLLMFMDTEEKIEENLWQHIPKTILRSVEVQMYNFAFEQMTAYLDESSIVVKRL